MNVYSELWELLRPQQQSEGGALFGTVRSASPLSVSVGETVLTEGLYKPAGMSVTDEDIGAAVALLPCETGFLILFFV